MHPACQRAEKQVEVSVSRSAKTFHNHAHSGALLWRHVPVPQGSHEPKRRLTRSSMHSPCGSFESAKMKVCGKHALSGRAIMQTFHFTSFEKGIVLTLSSVFFCRMTGLFMPLPILALAAAPMQGFSPFLLGWALGIHGLTQALLQVPLGILSDRIGRRKLIVAGLLVFILGSSLAALSESIYSLIVARALQGAGAVSSVMMACAADYLRPTVHAKGMAFIGLGIGSAFVLSLPLGSMLTAPWGLDGIFIIAAVLGAFAVLIALIGLPAESKAAAQQRLPLLSATGLKKVFHHPGLLHLNVGIFVLHFILAANFLVLPHLITILSGLELARHWQLYTPILLLSFVLMLPYLAYAERRKKTRAFLLSAIAFLGLSQMVLFACLAQGFTNASLIWFFISSLLVFFFAFNYLEANLPALLSRYSPVGRKGAAMGLLSSAQFLGVFAGAVGMGWLLERAEAETLYLSTMVLAFAWLVLAFFMPTLPPLADFTFRTRVGTAFEAEQLSDRLLRLPGVVEALVDHRHGVAHLKINRSSFDSEKLPEFHGK